MTTSRKGWKALGLWIFALPFCIAANAYGSSIYISKTLDAKVRERLIADLQYLENMPLAAPQVEFRRLLGVQNGTGAEVLHWLEERIHILMGPDQELLPLIRIASGDPIFSELDGSRSFNIYRTDNLKKKRADLERLLHFDSNDESVAINVGSGIFSLGKAQNRLYQIELDDLGPRVIDSPRFGLARLSPRYLKPMLRTTLPADSLALMALRLGDLLHEARHSDGHGANAGFTHVTCLQGDMIGEISCDSSLNGPLTLQAYFLEGFIQTCGSCSPIEIELLKEFALDHRERIIQFTPAPKEQKQLLSVQIEILKCSITHKESKRPKIEVAQCSNEEQARATLLRLLNPEITPGQISTEWDATPEKPAIW